MVQSPNLGDGISPILFISGFVWHDFHFIMGIRLHWHKRITRAILACSRNDLGLHWRNCRSIFADCSRHLDWTTTDSWQIFNGIGGIVVSGAD